MRIEFERSGGFAGMHIKKSLDTDDLEEEEARKLIQLVEESGFFGLPEKLPPSPGADRFHFVIKVQSEDSQHVVETGEASAPETLRPLLDMLMTLARRG